MSPDVRRSGVPLIGDIPWGTHFCQFYQTKQDLCEVLVGYFRQGLEDNEFCMWVTSEPLGTEEARAALEHAVPDLDDRINRGQIEFHNYRDWYVPDGRFEPDRILAGWARKERSALDRGFAGLRLTGNTFWLEKADWRRFTEYEEAIDRVIGARRMMAVCTYSLDRCGAPEIMDVIRNHQFALIRQEGRWERIQSSRGRVTEQALRESEGRFQALATATKQRTRRQKSLLEGINRIFRQALDCRTHEELGRTCLQVAEELTGSTMGFVAEINPEGRLDDIALHVPDASLCAMQEHSGHERLLDVSQAHGFYGRVLREGKGFFTNSPSIPPEQLPAGHPVITSLLAVPLLRNGEPIGMLGLANREGGYGRVDLESAEALAVATVQFLAAHA